MLSEIVPAELASSNENNLDLTTFETEVEEERKNNTVTVCFSPFALKASYI
jgi:hypothetical protein